MNKKLLSINDLNVAYGDVQIVKHFSMDIHQGEIVGIVGESGSGKSTMLKSILGLLDPPGRITDGKILFNNTEIPYTDVKKMSKLRGGQISFVFQAPEQSLDPLYTIRKQFRECVHFHQNLEDKDIDCLAEGILTDLQFDEVDKILDAYPFELSGGMCQRVVIAMAMANNAALFLADEPTSALDVTVQKEVLNILKKMRDQYGATIFIVSHNMGVIAEMADTIGVMYHGKLIEVGQCHEVIKTPGHPYTKALIQAIPRADGKRPVAVEGAPIAFGMETGVCDYYERCSFCDEKCMLPPTEKKYLTKTHWIICHQEINSEVYYESIGY